MNPPPRAQMRRVKGFRKPPGSILCTRPGPLGNPFFVTGPEGEGENRQEAVDAFERWALAILKNRVPINLSTFLNQCFFYRLAKEALRLSRYQAVRFSEMAEGYAETLAAEEVEA